MDTMQKHLQILLDKYSNCDQFTKDDLKSLDIFQNLTFHRRKNRQNYVFVFCAIFILIPFGLECIFTNNNPQCFIDMPDVGTRLFRYPERDCLLCRNLEQIIRLDPETLQIDEIYTKFISNGRPLVIVGGAKHWEALNTFNFEFFKQLYLNQKEHLFQRQTCQFFRYKTEFTTLRETLSMDEKRANLETGQKPWYIGWSNCDDEAGRILKKYYQIPTFLTNTSESISLNWIFMGGPGHGAHMHIDNVKYPSWQAQLKGRKLWRLAPPPECHYKCKKIEVILEPGDLIVVDTNRWYHQTEVLPGDLSISIGSEFD